MTDKIRKYLIPSVISGVAIISIILVVVFLVLSDNGKYRFIKIDRFDGGVAVSRKDESIKVFEGLRLFSKDEVEVDENSLLLLVADDNKKMVVEGNTKFELYADGKEENGKISIELLYGKIHVNIEEKLAEDAVFQVTTPNATMSVRGTAFTVEYYPEEVMTVLYVERGKVLAEWDGGSGFYGENQGVIIYDHGERTEEFADEGRSVLVYTDEKDEEETTVTEETITSEETIVTSVSEVVETSISTTVPAETTTSVTTAKNTAPEVTTSYTAGGSGASSDEHSGTYVGTNPSDDELSDLFEVVDDTTTTVTTTSDTVPEVTTSYTAGGSGSSSDEHSGTHIGTNPSDDEFSDLFEVVDDTTPAVTTEPRYNDIIITDDDLSDMF